MVLKPLVVATSMCNLEVWYQNWNQLQQMHIDLTTVDGIPTDDSVDSTMV